MYPILKSHSDAGGILFGLSIRIYFDNVSSKNKQLNLDIKKRNTSGTVKINEHKIIWTCDGKVIVEVNADEIIVIGEYTNNDGPILDDWFLVMVTKDANWQSIPMYAENIQAVESFLENKFEAKISSAQLTNSTEWNSRISYPPQLYGQELFRLEKSETFKEPKSIFDKLLCSVGFGNFNTSHNIHLTDVLLNEIKQLNQ